MAVQLPDSDSDRHTCDYCESHVTADFRRTYGTDGGRAKRCPECDSWPRIERGSARGQEVDHPDPQPLAKAHNAGGSAPALTACSPTREVGPNEQIKLKVNAVLSRFQSGSGEYVGDVLDYLEVCWAKAGFDQPFDGAIVEYNTGNCYQRHVIGSLQDQRTR